MAHRTVFVNGCFDIIHRGHVELLEFAKSHGEYLVVALDTDERVRHSKGDASPFNCLNDRKKVVSSIGVVDWVESFSSDEELTALVKQYAPDTMVVGSDYQDKTVIGSEFAKEIRFFERIDGYSTTKILQNSTDRG